MPASLAALWGSAAFWAQQLGLWPCRTPPLGLGVVGLLLPWGLCSDFRPCEVRGQSWALRLGSVPRTRKPWAGGVPGASCGGTPGGTARPRTPLDLDEGPGARKAAPTALPPGRRRAPVELDGRRRCCRHCAVSRPRRGPGQGRRRALWFAVRFVCFLSGEAHGLVC